MVRALPGQCLIPSLRIRAVAFAFWRGSTDILPRMPFVDSARARVARLHRTDRERIVLEFLLENAIGAAHAKPWDAIEGHLTTHDVWMSQKQFQQTILKSTREGDIFIGVSRDGYFLINDKGDAEITRAFYRKRIKKELANLENLEQLIRDTWPGV